MPLDRYTSRDTGRTDSRTARERLYDLMEAHQAASGQYVGKEESRMERERQDQARNWGDSAAQGATMGFTASGGNPIGALVGGIIGSAAGQYKAYKDRRRSGQNFSKALGATLTDFTGGLPSQVKGLAASSAVGTAVAGQRARRQSGGSAYDALLQRQQAAGGQDQPGADEAYTPDFNLSPEEQEALRMRNESGMRSAV